MFLLLATPGSCRQDDYLQRHGAELPPAPEPERARASAAVAYVANAHPARFEVRPLERDPRSAGQESEA